MVTSRHRRQLPVPLLFFVLAFLWTWTLWWTAAATGRSTGEPSGSLLWLLGAFGPLVGAAWVVRRGGRVYRREFLRRVWDPRRIPAIWWFALVAVVAGPAALGTALARAAGASATVPDYSVGIVVSVVAIALVAGFVEEPGWRGAASDAWQTRTRPVWAALGIGALWALWHLPLHFVEGTYQYGIDFGSVRFWLTNLALTQLGVLYLWLANGSGGSILIAILAHAGVNISGELMPSSTMRDVIAFLVVTVATLVVILATRGQLGLAVASSRGHQTDRSEAEVAIRV